MVPLVTFSRNHPTRKCRRQFAVCLPFGRRNNPQPKQSLAQFGNVVKPVNAKGRMKQQQSATAGNCVEALG